MPRYMRAFTFDSVTLAEFDNILEGGPNGSSIKELFSILPRPAIKQQEALQSDNSFDSHDLSKEDYEALHQMLPKSPQSKLNTEFDNWDLLTNGLHQITNLVQAKEVAAKIYAYQVANRREARKYKTAKARAEFRELKAGVCVNASRVADALLVLGMAVLKERTAAILRATQSASLPSQSATLKDLVHEPIRSSQGHERQVEVERAVGTRRRKA